MKPNGAYTKCIFNKNKSSEYIQATWGWEMASLINYLLYNHEDKSSIPSIQIKKKKNTCVSLGL